MRRILFIGLKYFEYTDRIIAELRLAGHEVDAYPIEKSSRWIKLAKRLLPKLYERRRDGYHAGIVCDAIGQRYDIVLFLQVHQFALSNLAALRVAQPDARFVLYNWDSLSTHDYRPWLRYFDKAASFDPVDAQTLGIEYLPLFALPEYFEVATDRATEDYDLYFVGSMVTTARFDAIRGLADHCAAAGLRLSIFGHCSPPGAIRLLQQGRWMRGMTLRSIDTDGILDVMRRSRAVFDFANHRQSGYTMRFVENLCAGKKIVATNPRIADEPFFSSDRFLLVADGDFSGLASFLATPVTSRFDFEAFSLASWARRLLA